MQAIDLFEDADESLLVNLACDVCIVGSGPAGSAIARELSNTHLRVILLESGGYERKADIDALNDIVNVGRARQDQWGVRNRIVGGSSFTWGGRSAPFDEIDFEERAWVPYSGWPFGLEELHPYLERSTKHIGLAIGAGFSDNRFWALAGKRPPDNDPDPNVLLPFFWQHSRDDAETYPYEYTRIGRHLATYLGTDVTLIAGATVLRVLPVTSGRAARGLEFAGPDGTTRILDAPVVILCGGGIENARMLLASDTVTPKGLGNQNDLVGRFFMDHIRGPVGQFDLRGSELLQKRFGRFNLRDRLFRAGLRLSPAIQRKEQLLNCALWLGEELSADDPWVSLRNLLGGQAKLPQDLFTMAANTDILLRGVKDYLTERNGVPRKLDALQLICMCEQQPDPESRITLANQRDRFGIPLSRVDWRTSENESRSMRRAARLTAEQLERMGFPAPKLAQWVLDEAHFPDDFLDVAHPTGATRMSENPKMGVVDADCQVHGVSGLYVAGTSVFPTGGHCNPTQMIVAMAVRLADHVKANALALSPASQSAAG